MNKKIKILIAGPIFPPAGGISIHLQRLNHLFCKDYDFSFIDESDNIKPDVFNIRSFNIIGYFKRVYNTDLFFIHSGNKYFKKINIVIGKVFRKKIIITIHGYGKQRSLFFKIVDSFIFNLSDKIILVNSQISSRLNLDKNKCLIKNAFLPPDLDKEQQLPAFLTYLITLARSENKVIICSNASRLNTFNNEDLYGLDMCIESTRSIVEKGYSIHFTFIVSSLQVGKEKFENGKKLIEKYNLENNFLLINQELTFVNLMRKTDIVLRPTNTDGDALTIREAIYFNKHVIASDIVERPEGSILFRTRDFNDLDIQLEKLIININSNSNENKINLTSNINNDLLFYKDLFQSVMES